MRKRLLSLLLAVVMVLGMLPKVTLTAEASSNYELKTLTFEDADYKGGTNYAGGNNWSSMIDASQYSGSLLYPSDASEVYNWYDKDNTFLKHAFADAWGDHQFWGGGHAISHYNASDFATYGNFENQLTVYNAAASGVATTGGGHNGSDNFAIHFGYVDNSGYSGTIQQSLTFGDGVARVIDHMYVNNTTYALNCYANGNELTTNIRDTDWVKLIATGHHADGTTATAELYLVDGPDNIVKDWTKWDLSGLGAVTKVEFNVTGTNDNGYGFSQPGYFAYDDVAVRFEKACEHTETTTAYAAAENQQHMATVTCNGCGEQVGEAATESCTDEDNNGKCDLCGGDVASAESECLSVAENAPTGVTIKAGEKYTLKLSDVFADSEGHALTYSFASTIENQHTKIADGVFYFSAAAGTYEVTLTAKCEAKEVSHKLTITVEAGNQGIAAQYNYNETDADSVKVYVTLSNDGYPVTAKDGTPMSHLEVTVPYFDLALYGLEDYYRYGTNGGSGEYINDTVIKRPTGLHLYIYLLERYYMGMDEADCGKGESEPLSYAAETDVVYMDGTAAYSSDGKRALQISGGPTSLYMVNFWGHDENLMYFRNHCYPYMSPGWGSTSDYILLSDGDTWDVAMFSNWEFHNYGYFARFDQDVYTAETGKPLTVKTQKWGTSAASAGFADVTGLDVSLYTAEWEPVEGLELAYDSETGNSLTFTAPAAAGTYYLMAMDPNAKDAEDACIAPATAVVTVTAGTVECETCTDENTDRVCDVCGKNLNNLPTLAEGVENQTATVQTGWAYQVDDLVNGNIFTDADSDSLTYSYRKSSNGGETWGDWTTFGEALEHGGVNKSLSNSVAGTYTYEFKANDGFGDSEARWKLTLQVVDELPANVNFYVGRDNNYSANGSIMPVLELYKTAGLDEDLYDYVGWFEKDGKTEYVYNPQDYTILDGETDYVVIDEVQYELHDYEKVTFTNSAFDAADETATASGTVVNNYNMFYATILTGRYSTRVYGYNTATFAYDIYLGGQSMELPMEKDIYGNGGNDIYLRQIDVYTTSKKLDNTYFTAEDYYAEVIMPITGGMIHSGDPYVSGNYVKFPFFMWAAGNGSLYNAYVYPYDTDNYIFSQQINLTTSKGTSVVSRAISISTVLSLTVTVPETADFKLYFQYNNFNTKEMAPMGEAVANGDGTKTLTFKVSKNSQNYTWRMTDTTGRYVTRAGWLAGITGPTAKTYTFDATSPTDKKTHSFRGLGTTVGTRDEADLQVFLSATGFKSVSGTTRIRAYRMWEIINSDPGNIMVEPDFNIQVLQGNPADISLVSGGNVKNNWIDVTPTTTDIVAVNYDALEVLTTADVYGSHGGLYPATNPERTNVFIITNQAAGTAVAHIPFNGSKSTDRGAEWDYNYDTWSYLNTDAQPNLNFTVSAGSNLSVSYAYVITGSDLKSNMSGWNYPTADETGTYNVSLLPFRNAGTKGGTVIIKMTDSTGTSYALVRVAEMAATVTNVTTPGEPFTPGDQVSITFDGLYRSINKISGIFNPTTYYLRYTAGGVETNGSLPQYQQMDSTSIKLTIPEDIEFPEGQTTVDYSFTNGYVYGSMYAAASPFQSMYYITDTGVGTNFSAVGVSFVMSRLADIPITVEQKVYHDVKLAFSDGENPVANVTVSITDPNGNALTPDENGIYQDLTFGDYHMDIAAPGFRRNTASLHLGSADASAVVDGILVKTILLEKGGEGCWDGTSVSEPKTDASGVYQIGTGAELTWFAQTVNAGTTGISAVLTADIDLGSYDWTPIGSQSVSFSGNLDGQNHKITGLYLYSTTGATYQGLFGSTGSSTTISNLTVEGSIYSTSPDSVSQARIGGVSGNASGTTFTNVHANVDITIDRVKGTWANVGGLAGMGGQFTNCSNSGDISAYQSVGGIAGSGATSITGCFNSGNISGYQKLGGITGTNSYGAIIACYNTGDITGTSTYVAGIIPDTSKTVTNCFNTGTISIAGNTGAIIGRLSSTNAVVTNNYYLKDSHSAGIGTNGKEQHEATMVTAETMASRDFAKAMNVGLETPAYAVGTDHPILSWQDPNAEVIAPVLVSQLTLSAETLTVYLGETAQLTATVNEDADDKTLTWTSSDANIATVDANGVVTPVAAGTVTITAATTDGSGKTASCTVTVAEKPAVVYGDVNGDGEIDSLDASVVYAIYNETYAGEVTELMRQAADVNGDNEIDSLDATLIYGYYNETVEQFSVENK